MKGKQAIFIKDTKRTELAKLKLALILCGVSVLISLGVIIGLTII